MEISVTGSEAATATTPPFESLTSEREVLSERVNPVTMRPETSGVPNVADETAELR
jgi:hypothetical protein